MMSLSSLLPLLPEALCREVRTHPAARCAPSVCEVRLRRGRPSSLSVFRDGALCNLPLSHHASEEELTQTLARAADGSVYAHEESLREGFLPMKGGIRLGVCGRATPDGGGGIKALSSISSLVFRLPHAHPHAADELCNFFEKTQGGILLFAPPGGGKTTHLRAFIQALGTRYRIAAVDTREELCVEDEALLLDCLSGYPKRLGAEIALRTLSPEILVLDELGKAECDALCALVSFGVRTVATVHAQSADEVRRAPAFAPLLRSGLFSHLWDVRGRRPSPLWEERA
ncbi:MAG: hypothetical protein IJV96_00300 [Clostridia bacterium]|nr:hypothetical protein [Clostridia bacterium]